MRKRNQAWRLTAGVASGLLLAPVIASFGMMDTTNVVYAAEQKAKTMSQEEAVKAAQKWISVPSDYKLSRVNYIDAIKEPFYRKSVWRINWDKSKVGGIMATIDAESGELMQYFKYSDRDRTGSEQKKLTEDKALEIAQQFLERVTTPEIRQKLSKPNEYGPLNHFMQQDNAFTFTRVENGIPFLENGFQLIVGQDGQIDSYTREWDDGKLPDAKQAIAAEKAQKLLEEQAVPSLVYKEKAAMTSRYDQDRGQYQLVYLYDQLDPQYVDAISGNVINSLGDTAEKRVIKPLGSTTRNRSQEDKLITKDEAQKIAEHLIKRLPGSYRFDGSSGGGSSSGPDGIVKRNWRFEFTPLQSGDSQPDPVHLSIDDRGELQDYSVNERFMYGESGRKIEKSVPWEQAEANALKLVKSLYADRLGEIYLIGKKPSEDSIKKMFERGGQYEVRFGWLKDGIPIENMEFRVSVDPETGDVESMRTWMDDFASLPDSSTAGKVDLETAKKAEQAQKTMMLTYYLPQTNYYDVPFLGRQPMLVYRYVGDQGVVNGNTGEWVSFEKIRKDQTPQDIAGHPKKNALEFAVQQGFLTVKDGKVEPNKEVTRGEMVLMINRLTDRSEFYMSRSHSFYDDEEDKRYNFTDVDQKHPQYAAIQRGVQYGLIPKEGNRFEPDKPITRAEAADMVARLLGYSDLLNKPGIFASPYQDVQKKDIPAVTLVTSQGLLPGKSTASFESNAKITRAEAAQLMQALLQLRDPNKK